MAASYEDKVVDYCIEWERIITSRVDAELKETNKMHFKLNHYTSKVLGLRKKVNSHNNRGNETPDKKLSEKLKRNEVKLQDAWKAHERSASKLCDLIEEVTARGWKDLYPLVTASMQLEVERASGEYSDIAKLAVISDSLTDFFNNSMSAELNSAHNHTAIATGTIESATLDRLHQGNNNSNKGQKEKNMLPELKSSRLVIENNDTDPKSTAPFFTKEKDLIPLINGDVTDAGWCKAPASPRRNDARKDGRLKLFESRVPHVVETSQSGSALETDDCESEWTGSTHLGDSTPYDEDQTAASPHRNAIAPKVTSTPDSPNAVQQF